MTISNQDFHALLSAREDEHLEFKEAKKGYGFESLVKYCVALANEGGGRIVLGVTDKVPRCVVGTSAFDNREQTAERLADTLRIRVELSELQYEGRRVVVFDIPARPIGVPIEYKGAYWMRSGQALTPMTSDMLKSIFKEASSDWSAEPCSQATLEDLSSSAIDVFRRRWSRKVGRGGLLDLDDEQILIDAELITDRFITNAALVLLGTRESIRRLVPSAETVFEYRASEAAGASQERQEFCNSFFLFYDDLWRSINFRNDIQHFHDGLFVRDIRTFNEVVIREALLNAVAHRDYQLPNSIFVRQFPRRIEIESPGGLPPGVTPENILRRQNPRNRRIAEALARCGLVERSGQGVNLMFEESIKESKPFPDFSGTDAYLVSVVLHGRVNDPRFVNFLEKVGQETLSMFRTDDFILLDILNRDVAVPSDLKTRLSYLLEQGVVERMGRGRGVKYMLSRRFYDHVGKSGAYTRRRGLDRDTNKELLYKHIRDYGSRGGSRFSSLHQVLPSLTRDQVKSLLSELRAENRILCRGRTRAAKWFPVGR